MERKNANIEAQFMQLPMEMIEYYFKLNKLWA